MCCVSRMYLCQVEVEGQGRYRQAPLFSGAMTCDPLVTTSGRRCRRPFRGRRTAKRASPAASDIWLALTARRKLVLPCEVTWFRRRIELSDNRRRNNTDLPVVHSCDIFLSRRDVPSMLAVGRYARVWPSACKLVV